MQIICVGNRPDTASSSLLAEYEKRLRGKFKLSIRRLKPFSSGKPELVKQKESAMILEVATPGKPLILLDERGSRLTSEEFAELVNQLDGETSFVIGGAHGVGDSVIGTATRVIRLSDMVLPHRLALILLTEQLYRAQCIINGHPYHHG